MGTLGRERALFTIRETFGLEEWAGTVYAALDDALKEAGVVARGGKRVPRPAGPGHRWQRQARGRNRQDWLFHGLPFLH
jgi:hypothetical protein